MKAGDVLLIDRRCSVQFMQPMRFRLIRQLDWTTFDGWVWLDGYQLNDKGDAVERRSIFVMKAGVQRRTAPAPAMVGQQRRSRSPQRR